MIGEIRNTCAAFLLLTLAWMPGMAIAADEACAGITQKCTRDKTYDKTINGSIYSCYDCTQALCEDGGNGGISGSATSSVCTEKATTLVPLSIDDESMRGSTLTPKSRAARQPGRNVDPRTAKFDEADALFGSRVHTGDAKRTEERNHQAAPSAPRDGTPGTAPADPTGRRSPAPAPPIPIPYPNPS